MPLWAAVTIVAAAYAVRSGLRGWDFRPDLPIDAVIATTLVALVALRLTLARSATPDEAEQQRPPEMPDDNGPADRPGRDDKVGPGVES